jgi:hypothetical protein
MASMRDSWSEPIDDLRARVRVEPEDLGAGMRHAVYLELLNCAYHPRALTDRPEIRAALLDSAGNALQPAGVAASGPVPPAQWAVIPRDGYIGLRIDHRNFGVPAKPQRVALLALGAGGWMLGAGTYSLELAARFERVADGPENQWVGELLPPAVELEVTAQLFAS